MSTVKSSLPVIAVVTDLRTEPPFFESIQKFCEELQQIASVKGCLFYVFSLFDFHSDHVYGYYYSDKQWVKATFPHPDVIYNRIHSRKFERSEQFLIWKEQINQLGIPLFNDRFLSKWEVYEVTIKHKHLRDYIPDTRLYSNNQLKEMLNLYSTVFLKPIHGSQGRNIIRVRSILDEFRLEITGHKDVIFSFCTVTELVMFIKNQIGNRPFIIQQGIHFIRDKNRPLDFRVLCHVHSKNCWRVTSVVARIPAEQQIVSNLSHGGEIEKPLVPLNSHFAPNSSQEYLTKLKKLAIDIASTLANQVEGVFGEFGIDLGIDTNGDLWLIEVNSKPSKNFTTPSMPVRPSAKAIMQNCFQLLNIE